MTERIRANRTQGWRAVGGHLVLGDEAIAFEPHGFDRSTGGASWAAPWSSVAAADLAPAFTSGGLPFGGGLRSRLRLRLQDGTEQLFVVPRLQQVLAQVQHHLG
jgi:hypothetical protein